MDIKVKFGIRVKYLRDQRKLSQEKLALYAGVDRAYYQKVEKGKINISIKNQYKISQALGVDIKELFEFEVNDNNNTKEEK